MIMAEIELQELIKEETRALNEVLKELNMKRSQDESEDKLHNF